MFSQDRYYTLLNASIDENLAMKSKLLLFMTSYLFQSGNFKHKGSIANGKTKGMWAFDIICWLSMVGFVLCFLFGVATPLVASFKGGSFNFEALKSGFQGTGAILLSIALVLLVISIAYLILIFKIKKKNKTLSLKDYVQKKLEFVLKFKMLIKVSKIMGEAKKVEEILIMTNCDILNDTDRWLFLQVTNLMFMLFNDFNLILQFNNVDEVYFNSLKDMINHDFKNLSIINIGAINILPDENQKEVSEQVNTKKIKIGKNKTKEERIK
ncbi:MAG: hypothetical protein ACRCRZ_02540 [Metamycoplasmataceae bacterium]